MKFEVRKLKFRKKGFVARPSRKIEKKQKFHAYAKRQILLSLELFPQKLSKDVEFYTDKHTKSFKCEKTLTGGDTVIRKL